jgi:hypothetical protein
LLHLGFAGLLHPAAGRMFAAFHGSSALGSLPGASVRSSRRCSHPPKFSSSTAAPRHRGPCLLAVRLRLPGYVRPFERPRFRGRSWFDTCADRAGRSPPSEWLVGVTSACAAASQVRLPRGSASWSADVRGCPQTSDSDSDSRLPTPPISRDGSADPSRAPPGLPRRDTASTRENRRVAPLAVRCRRALLGRHARARSAPTSAGGVVARIASHRLPDRRWRSLVPGSLRRSGVGAAVPSSRSFHGWSRPRAGFFDVQGSRPAWPVATLDGPRERLHPGSGGCPPAGSELAPRLGPIWIPVPSRASAAPRAARYECGGSRGSRPGPTGSHRHHAVAVWKPARGDDRTPLARRRRIRGRGRLTLPSLARASRLRPGASLDGLAPSETVSSRGFRGLLDGSGQVRATTSLAPWSARGHAVEVSFGLGDELALASGLRSWFGLPCAGVIGLLRWPPSSGRKPLPPDPKIGRCYLRFVARCQFE